MRVHSSTLTAFAAAVVVACAGQSTPPRLAPAAPVESPKACGGVAWVRELVSEVDMSVRQLAATPDGGVIAIAQLFRRAAVRESGNTLVEVTSRGLPDALVVALKADGRVAWVRRIGAEKTRVEPTAVLVRSDGSILVAGSYAGAPVAEGASEGRGVSLPALVNEGATKEHRLFFVWYAADGTPQRAFTSSDVGSSRSVARVAPLGDDLAVLGTFTTTLTLGSGPRAVTLDAVGSKSRAQDVFVGVLDAAGEPRWLRRIGGPGADFASALGVKKDGSLVVAGSFARSSGYGADAPLEPLTYGSEPATLSVVAGQRDAFLMELDRSGRRKWWKALGGDEGTELGVGDYVAGIATSGDGDAVLVANLPLPARLGDKGPELAVAGETGGAFLLRLDGNGQTRWTLPLGPLDARGITALPDGDVAVSAHAEGELRYPLGGKKQSPLSIGALEDMVLARHAPDGELRWVTRFGGDGTEWGEAVSSDPAGALLAGGRLHRDFLLEQAGCSPAAVRGISQDHVNSFVVRIPPGADPSNEARELRVAALKIKVDKLKKEAAAARQAGDERLSCGKLDTVTSLTADEPGAWVELGDCRARLSERDPALAAYRKAIALASRHNSVIVESHETARLGAYRGLAGLGVNIGVPARGECGAIERAPGCKVSLWACSGEVDYGSGTGVRIGTSEKVAAAASGADIEPVMPSLGRQQNRMGLETWPSSHNWFQRQDSIDVLISERDVSCKIVTADACLGLIGVVCTEENQEGTATEPSVDEFYLWPERDPVLEPESP